MNYINRMRVYLNKTGISQVELAKRIGIERGLLNKILLGKKTPSQNAEDKLIAFFEANP